MKKFFTLCALFLLTFFSHAQVVLNEIYTSPGNNKSEFFEFYNTSPSLVPENMDNYTLVTYFEESGVPGFYVMDLPNQTVASKGFYVGAAANPFSVQGQNNIPANFNWNVMPAGGYLKKFLLDGVTYKEVGVPANLNDIFVKRTAGSGAVQHIFVFQNGNLINGLFTGTNKATIPSYIRSMPPLFVDMSGSSPDFTINFNAFNDNQFEYVTATEGVDNGYTRESDGKCGVWIKSTSSNTHTPGVTNGSASGLLGDISITAYLTEISGEYTKSLLVYDVTASDLTGFPLTVEVYQDLGFIGQLDGTDVLIDSRVIYTLTEGDQYVVMPSRTDPALIVAKTPSGCFDQVVTVANNLSTLPVHLMMFQGNLDKNNKVSLNWEVADNETVSHFELQKSVNGAAFKTAALVFASEKSGTEEYEYYETINENEKVMYRLKMYDLGDDIDYSKILVFQNSSSSDHDIKIIGNPVNDKLTFSYTSSENQTVDIRVYDLSGRTVLRHQAHLLAGSNLLSEQLNETFKPGMYVLELSDGTNREIAKFIKL